MVYFCHNRGSTQKQLHQDCTRPNPSKGLEKNIQESSETFGQSDAVAPEPLPAKISDEEYDRLSKRLEELALLEEQEQQGKSQKKEFSGASKKKSSGLTFQKGFLNAKKAAASVCEALENTPVTLDSGRLIRLQFRTAQALRDDNGTERKIKLIFRAVIDQD